MSNDSIGNTLGSERAEFRVEEEIRLGDGFGSDVVEGGDVIGGRAFQCFSYIHPALQRPLKEYAGWVYDGGRVLAPDPARFVGFMDRIGVPIRFIEEADPEGGHIPSKIYGATVAGGCHPVSVSSKQYYLHDISADHLPAVFAGGKPLVEAIGYSALAAGLDMAELARIYDSVTSILSDSVTWTLNSAMKGRAVDRIMVRSGAREVIINCLGGGGEDVFMELETILTKGLKRLELI